MVLNPLYLTACGGRILVAADTVPYFAAHPEAAALLDEAVGRITLPSDGSRLKVAVDLGRALGPQGCVEAPDIGLDRPGLFAQRHMRRGLSRVVQIDPERLLSVSTLAVIAHPTDDPRAYRLVTAYVGAPAPAEPWAGKDDDARMRLLDFWRTHALVWNEGMAPPCTRTWRAVLNDVPLGEGGPHD